MRADEYLAFDGIGLAELVRKKEVTPLELVDVALARVDALNPDLNAVVVRRDGKVRAEASDPAKGPFRGVPFLVKDMDGVLAGEPNTSSTRALADWVPTFDSDLFARYKASGLLIIGKTNAPEFGIFGVTESELRGTCRNPWNLNYTPGGSSGGSAAAVAAGIVPVAHGGDGGGSIRIPASHCGLFGLKPSRGRQPLGPLVGEGWNGLVVPHVVSRSVRDSAAMLDVTRGADPGAPYAEPPAPRSFLVDSLRAPGKLRIGFSTKAILGPDMDPANEAAVRDAVILLGELGHELIEIDLPFDRDELSMAYLTIVAANVANDVASTEDLTGVKPKASMFELATWFLKQVGDELSAHELEYALAVRNKLSRNMAALYDGHDLDAHLSATCAYPPALIGKNELKVQERLALSALRRASTGIVLRTLLSQLAASSLNLTPNTQVFNMTGQPAMNVPLWWNDEGLPVGVQFAGRFGAEKTLFRLGRQLEEARPWAGRWPAIASA